MRHIPNGNHPRGALHLRMAFEAEVIVALGQQFRIDRTVNIVTGNAPFPEGFVLENVGFGLLAVTLGALRIDTAHKRPLRRIDVGPMRIVTGGAAHPAFQHRMVILQTEFGFLFQMALEAGFRVFLRVDDELATTTAGIHVQAGGTMTGFAASRRTDAITVAGNFQPGMLGELKILGNGLVTRGTLLHADILGTRNNGWRSHDTLDGGTGDRQRRHGHSCNARNRPNRFRSYFIHNFFL